jgi:hypothetical protein
MVQEEGWALVDSVWVVMVDQALVRFRVMSSEIETSLAAIYGVFADINIERFLQPRSERQTTATTCCKLDKRERSPRQNPSLSGTKNYECSETR